MALDPFIADVHVKTGQTNELIERTRTYLLDILEKANKNLPTKALLLKLNCWKALLYMRKSFKLLKT